MITSKTKTIASASFREIPILGVEYVPSMKRSLIFNQDGSIGTIIRFNGINDSSFGESDYQKVNMILAQAIKNLDTHEINCQFMAMNSIDNTVVDCTLENLPPHLIERNRFLREEMIKNGEIFRKEFFISFNCIPSPREEGFIEGWKRKIKTITQAFQSKVSIDNLDAKFSEQLTIARIRKLNTTVKSFTTALKELKCVYQDDLSKQEVIDIYRSILARSKHDNKKPYQVDDKDFKRSLLSGTRTYEKPFSHVVHDDYFYRTYSLDRVSSSEWVNGDQLKAILNVNFEYIYTVNFRLMNHRESSKKIDRKLSILRFLNSESAGNNKKVEDVEAAIELNDAEEIRHRFAEGGSYGVECSINFTYMINEFRRNKIKEEGMLEDDDYVLELDQVLHHSNFGKVAQSEWVALPGQWQILCQNLPGVTNVSGLFVDTMIELPNNITYLLPLYDQKRLDLTHYGINHFYTDYNTIVPYEYFDKTQESFVTLIFGVMGTGKSVTINLILSLLYQSRAISGKDPIVRGLDFGGAAGSYYKLAKLVGGTILNFSTSKKPKINPFYLSEIQRYPTPIKLNKIRLYITEVCQKNNIDIDLENLDLMIESYYNEVLGFEDRITDAVRFSLIEKEFGIKREFIEQEDGRENEFLKIFVLNPGECEPSLDAMNLVSGIIEVMLSPVYERVVVDYERSQVVQLIQLLFRNTEGRFPYLRELFALIKEIDEDSIFLPRLAKWVNGGTYRMFDGDGDIDLSSDFVLFDMAGLDRDPQLKMIYTALISQVILDDMYKKMDRSRMFIGDEIWAALESDTLRKFIVAFSRTSRKYKFGMILATQLPTDFFDASGSDGEKIVSLANNFIFCGFRDKNIIKKTCALYGLSPAMGETLSKMGVADGEEGSVVKKFSRFVMISNKKSGKEISIFRNILSPLEYQLYSSSKEDNAIVKYYHEVQGVDILSTIKYIAAERHIGDPGLMDFLTKNNHFEALEMVQKRR